MGENNTLTRTTTQPPYLQWITVPGLEDTRQLMSDLVEARVVAPPGGIFHPTCAGSVF